MNTKLLIAFGTRPEVIKCAPVISRFKASEHWKVATLHTGQHTDLTEPLIDFFGIKLDENLNVMQPGLSLDRMHARIMQRTADVLDKTDPDFVLAQGDTLSVLCLAESAFYRKIPFIHLEAGLRTYELSQPFPEEMHRQVVGRLAAVHLCSTQKALNNLKAEQVDTTHAYITGNTVIDTLLQTVPKVEKSKKSIFKTTGPNILVTVHRRENHGKKLDEILAALRRLSRDFLQDIEIVIPCHPNPNVKNRVLQYFSGCPNVQVIPPLDYPDMVKALLDCTFIISDSGGLQEEAPALGKPVLVLRETTERTESLDAGTSRLVGTNRRDVYQNARKLIHNEENAYTRMAQKKYPYGTGNASTKILTIMNNYISNRDANHTINH